jgi:hypothetical protein
MILNIHSVNQCITKQVIQLTCMAIIVIFFAIVQIIILCLFYTKISLDGRTRDGEIRFHWMVEIVTRNGEIRFHWMVEIVTRNGEIRFHWMVEIVTRNGEIIYISQLNSSGCTKLFVLYFELACSFR